MRRLLLRRLVHTVIVLLLVTAGTASLLDLTPGDPAYAILGEGPTPEAVAAVHEDLGLDRPIYERYFDWLGNVVQGDFGKSYRANIDDAAREDVTDLIIRALPVTFELVVLSLLIALIISIPTAVVAAYRAGGRFDRFVDLMSSVLVATPTIVTTPILVYFVVVRWGMLPATGWVPLLDDPVENLRRALLPAFSMSLVLMPGFTTLLRSDMIATLQEDFILSARAKGLAPRAVLLRHALRPSLFSLLTSFGLSFGNLLGGAVIIETLFALPGLGSVIIASINAKDVVTVQGAVLFIAMCYVLINTLVDSAYTLIDPRVRLQRHD